jgi:hypothetical protein
VAAFTAPKTAVKGKSVSFDASASHDPDRDPITFAWRFGDGTTSTAINPIHKFAKAGKYQVRLIVSDDFGVNASVVRTITVTGPPCVVPRLVGKTIAAAKRALEHAHCRVGKISRRHSRQIKRGHVIGSDPRAGSQRKNGARVRLTVSSGRRQ